MNRPPALPQPNRNFWRGVFRASLISLLFWAGVAWALSSCSPRAYREVNKLAPEPPYAGQRPPMLSGALMYTEKYLRDEEPLDPND